MDKSNEVDAESLIQSLSGTKRIFLIISVCLIVFGTGADYTETQEFKNKIIRVERWRSLIETTMRKNQYTMDVDKVLALIAQESGGNSWIVADDRWGSTGLMQVGPRSWTPTQAQLKNPKINIEWGLWFLNGSLKLADGDWYNALRYYNCGKERADDWPSCGTKYANLVLTYWFPYFYTPDPAPEPDPICLCHEQ